MLLLSYGSFGQTPDYFANDPKWACGLWDSDQWGPAPIIPKNSTYLYYLNGDTLIGTQTFHRLFWRGETYEGGSTPTSVWNSHSGYYLRQDNKSIRFYNSQIAVDSLLVSYNYEIGDTVRGNIFWMCGHENDTIQKIDSILINSEYRRVFYLDSISGPVITEGIGHQTSVTGSSGEFIQPICVAAGFEYSIDCFGLGEIPYWDSQGSNGNCFLNVSLEEGPAIEFSIYPNPASHQITISSNLEIEYTTTIFDLSGNITVNSIEKIIDISSLSSGIYLIEVNWLDGNKSRKKLIIK